LGKIYSLEEIKEEIRKVTAEEIRKLSGEIFKFNNLCVSCVGDVDSKNEKIIKETVSLFQ
jgi:predicted Zn-dependent peptidase